MIVYRKPEPVRETAKNSPGQNYKNRLKNI